MRTLFSVAALATVALAVAPRGLAHGGEDHSHAPAATTTVSAGIRSYSLVTARVEAVLEVPVASEHHPQLLRVFLSDPATAAAVTDAAVRLRIPDMKLDVEAPPASVPGVHEVAVTPGMDGAHAVMIAVASTAHGDLLAFDSVAFGPAADTNKPSAWRRLLVKLGLSDAPATAVAAPAASTGPSSSVSKEAQFLFGLRTTRATAATLQARTKLSGLVVAPPDASAEIIAPQTGPTLPIDGAIPRLGDRVRAGQALVLLEGLLSSEERVSGSAALAEADARVIAESRELDLAERELARVEALPQVVSQKDREAAAARVDAARAGRDAAKRSAGILRASLADGPGSATRVVVKSPIDGVITQAHVAVGEIAEAGHVLFHVIDPAKLMVRADIPERDIARVELSPGAAAKIVSRIAVGVTGDATLAQSARSIDPVTRSIPVFFELAPGSRFVDGMLVDVLVDRGEPVTGVILPASSLAQLGVGRDVVFVKAGPERFEPRDVTLGVTDGESVEILSGLAGGELIVTSAVPRVRAALLSPGG